jgi:hypothetical protein
VTTLPYDTKKLITDAEGNPVPQYWSLASNDYEVAQGTYGASRTLLYDINGNPLLTVTNPGVVKISDGTDQLVINSDGSINAQLSASNVRDNQAIPTRQAGTTSLINNVVTVGATQTELKAGASPLSGRTQLILYPPAAGIIYWGATGVTAANGAPLAAGSSPLVLSFDPLTPLSIYAINDGTNRDVKVVEAK